ncbi:hypothetical protein [Ohtaekwangia sp.]|uniref:hypothetical protein n=1 Tax=Ohtaekwangia sp. TaxID=2066019 RepID=UPI002F94A769
MKKAPLLLIFIAVAACSPCYRKTKIKVVSSRIGKMVDHHLDLRRKNYFDYYQRIVGLTKIEHFKGSYRQEGDTLYFTFCEYRIPQDLTGKAYIDSAANEIVVLQKDPIYNQRLTIRKNRSKKQ